MALSGGERITTIKLMISRFCHNTAVSQNNWSIRTERQTYAQKR